MNRALSLCLVCASLVAAAGLLWRGRVYLPESLQDRTRTLAGKHSALSAGTLEDARHQAGQFKIFSRCAKRQQNAANLPLVLVHGFGVSGRYFIPLAHRLANDYPVFIPDLPGHGRSPTPAHALDIDGLAQALLDWLDALGLQGCVLVGQSMGAQIVVEAALRRPHRFAGLVLIGPTADPRAGLATHVWRLLQVAPYERLSLYWIIAVDYLRMGRRLVAECRAMLEDPVEEKLNKLMIPVLLMKGERDAVVPDKWFETLRSLIRRSCAAIIEGEGHAVQHSAPNRVAQALQPYLRDLAENKREGVTRTGGTRKEKQEGREPGSRTEFITPGSAGSASLS